MRPPRLCFLRNGRTYAVARDDRIEIRAFGRGLVRSWPIADAAIAAVGDELWIVSGDPPELARWAFSEQAPSPARAAGVVLPGLPAGELLGSPLSRATAAWNGTVPVAIVAGATTATGEVIERSDLLVPLTSSSWLDVLGSTITLRRGALRGGAVQAWHGQLPDGAVVRDAAPLGDGDRIGVLADLADGGRHAFVVATRDGEIQRTLACPGEVARLVPARGQLATADRARVALVDLISGQTLAEWPSRAPVLELASTHDTTHLVLADLDGVDEVVVAEVSAPRAASLPRPTAPAPGARPGPAAQRAADPFPDAPLVALWPRHERPLPSHAESSRVLELHTGFLAALAVRAIAHAWHTGRCNRMSDDLPHLTEVHGIIGDAPGVATAELAAADARVAACHGQLLDAVRALGDRHAPLTRLATEFALSPVATQILMIASAPILHGDLARLYRILTADPARPLLEVQLVPQLLHGRASRAEILRELDRDAPLVRLGMLELTGAAPFQAIVPHPTVVCRLRGVALDDSIDPGVRVVAARRTLAELHVPRAALSACLTALATPGAPPARLAVRGRAGAGRRSVLAAIAARAGRELAVIDVQRRDPVAELAGLRGRLRDAMLRGWVPCIAGLAPVARDPVLRRELAAVLDEHPGPVALRLAPGHEPIALPCVVLDLPRPTEAERAALWNRALARHGLAGERVAERLAGAAIEPGVIEQVTAQVAARRRGDSVATELATALRRHTEAQLAPFAERVQRLPSWSDVVLPGPVADSVRALIGRIRQRRRVFEDWGFDRTGHAPGAIAVLQGAAGTGKTLVAGVIARELGLELYRVEAAQIAARPEATDQNLAAVLDAADEGPAIVVFEDAEPLLARLALRRLDAFEGVALFAIGDGIELAGPIARRLTSRIRLSRPDAELREQLWQLHLPRALPCDADVDLRALARRHAISGGSIRNAALRAAVLAAEAGSVVTQAHLERAVRLEPLDQLPDPEPARPRQDA